MIVECGNAQVEAELKEPEELVSGKKTDYKFLLREKIAFEPQGKTILSKIVVKDKGAIIGGGNIHG